MENYSEYIHFVKRYYIFGVLLFGMILCVNCHENVAFKRDASVPNSNTEHVETDYEEYPVGFPLYILPNCFILISCTWKLINQNISYIDVTISISISVKLVWLFCIRDIIISPNVIKLIWWFIAIDLLFVFIFCLPTLPTRGMAEKIMQQCVNCFPQYSK